MWGKRRKRGTQLSRLLALGRLEEAMAQAGQQEDEPETVQYPDRVPPAAARPDPGSLRAAGVPVDNSAGPEPQREDAQPLQQELPAQRAGDSARHGTFG